MASKFKVVSLGKIAGDSLVGKRKSWRGWQAV